VKKKWLKELRKVFRVFVLALLLLSSVIVSFPTVVASKRDFVSNIQTYTEPNYSSGYVSEWNYTANLSPWNDEVFGLAVDSENNIIIAGSNRTALNVVVWNITKIDKKGDFVWDCSYNGTPWDNGPIGVAVDSEDNFVVSGYTRTSAMTEIPAYNWTIIKFNSTNHQLWSVSYNVTSASGGNNMIEDVAVDHEKNIIVVGYYNASTKQNDRGWHIVKFDQNGNQVWNKSVNPSDSDDRAYAVAVDEDNNIIVAGYDNLTSTTRWRIMEFDENNNTLATYAANFSSYNENARDVAVDNDDNIVVVGVDRSVGSQQWKVMKFDKYLNNLWNYTYDISPGEDIPLRAAVDSFNNITVVGYDAINGNRGWAVLKIGHDNATLWNLNYNPSDNADEAKAVVIDHNDDLIVGGSDRIAGPNDSQWRVMKFRSLSSRVHNINTGKNYATIQEAINANETLDGHTILVDAGTYNENIALNKQLNLIGDGPEVTIINAASSSKHAINVTCNNVKISGFKITGATAWYPRVSGVYLNHVSNISLSHNDVTNNLYGIRLYFSNNDSIVNNTIRSNYFGIYLEQGSCYNRITKNAASLNTQYGILIWFGSDNNLVSNNSVLYNDPGITLGYSAFNVISYNNVSNNSIGIEIQQPSNNNTICHNNIIKNNVQASSVSGAVNVWDDGYPSGGNYWSNHAGTDMHSGPSQNLTGSDGLGDILYTIDANNTDNYPLTAPISIFDAGTWNRKAYNIDFVSNSTISDFHFNPDDGAFIRFNITGESGTVGFCRVTIPKSLLWVEDGWTVLVGGEPITDYTTISDENYTYLYFTYNHSTKTVLIQGTHVIPEFPSALILPLLVIFTLVAVALSKRKQLPREAT